MGYYSTMEPIEFKTDYSAEEVKAKFQAFKDNRPNNSPWLDIYDFKEIRTFTICRLLWSAVIITPSMTPVKIWLCLSRPSSSRGTTPFYPS